MWPYKLGPVNWEMLGKQTQTSFRLRERDGKSKLDIMAPFPRAASLTQQPPGPKDEDPSLDDYDLYSLAHSFLDKARAQTQQWRQDCRGISPWGQDTGLPVPHPTPGTYPT
nr:uncharacterized protein LOC118967311 isoform X2 [Manis javanica]